eukprot:m.211272 g.211272  ORF g.211272 m.211272 type:complete len:303 (+) comp15059_c1_seq1:54-962(+)
MASPPFKFVDLMHGKVRYAVEGVPPSKGVPLTVCIHGFSTQIETLALLRAGLVKAQHTVLSLDLYGRGESDVAPVPNTIDLFITQIHQLLEKINETELNGVASSPFNLLGYSMGGAIVTHFASLYPERISSLVLLAPAGLPVQMPFTARLVTLPVIGTFMIKLFGKSSMLSNIQYGYVDQDANRATIEATQARISRQFDTKPGFADMLASTLRYFPMGGLRSSFEAVANETTIPVCLITADSDGIIAPITAKELTTVLGKGGNLQAHVIQNAGHDDIVTGTVAAPIVVEKCVSFLSQLKAEE